MKPMLRDFDVRLLELQRVTSRNGYIACGRGTPRGPCAWAELHQTKCAPRSGVQGMLDAQLYSVPIARTLDQVEARLAELVTRKGGVSRRLRKAQELGGVKDGAVGYRFAAERVATESAMLRNDRGVPLRDWSTATPPLQPHPPAPAIPVIYFHKPQEEQLQLFGGQP